MNKFLLYFTFVLMFFSSCDFGGLSPVELESYLTNQENNLIKNVTTSDLEFTSKYLPPELEAYKQSVIQSEDPKKINLEELNLLTNEFNNLTLFQVQIKGVNTKDPFKTKEIYEKVPEYVNFGIKQDLYLISGIDTILCNSIHLEHNSKINQELKWQIIFLKPWKDLNNVFYLVYHGGLSNEIEIKFDFNKNDLINIPQLKL